MFIRNFQFPEKEEVNKYYPQYYHKTDKVSAFLACTSPLALLSAGIPLPGCSLGPAASTGTPKHALESGCRKAVAVPEAVDVREGEGNNLTSISLSTQSVASVLFSLSWPP